MAEPVVMDELHELAVAEATVVAEHGPFMLTKIGATAKQPATFEEWSEAITWAQNVEKASPFWIGDLLVYGDMFGEEASQVLDATEYAEQTCRNAKYTCTAIPPDRRHADVPYAHHQELAALRLPDGSPDIDQQDAWLTKCEQENLTRDQLRVQLKLAKSKVTGQEVELWLMVKCANEADQQELAERLRLEGRSVKLQAKEAHAIHP